MVLFGKAREAVRVLFCFMELGLELRDGRVAVCFVVEALKRLLGDGLLLVVMGGSCDLPLVGRMLVPGRERVVVLCIVLVEEGEPLGGRRGGLAHERRRRVVGLIRHLFHHAR